MSTFRSHPDPSQWDDYVDYESTSWPRKDKRHYWIVPSICFNCESACGILAYVDKEKLTVRKIEGNPLHPGSRGRTCAKGVVTPNQLEDPDRILFPLKREGERGAGEWRRVTWDEALDDIGARVRKAIVENRRQEIMYHVGRPGEDGFANRVVQSWGLDGHNSHTNVCSSSARLGHFLWTGNDRPSPDYANAQTILLLSSHLETGHYFNPHAQRIIEGPEPGRDAHRRRSAAVEHVGEGRHVAAGVFGHRRRAAPRDGARAARGGSLRRATSCGRGSTGAATCARTARISRSRSTTSSSR